MLAWRRVWDLAASVGNGSLPLRAQSWWLAFYTRLAYVLQVHYEAALHVLLCSGSSPRYRRVLPTHRVSSDPAVPAVRRGEHRARTACSRSSERPVCRYPCPQEGVRCGRVNDRLKRCGLCGFVVLRALGWPLRFIRICQLA